MAPHKPPDAPPDETRWMAAAIEIVAIAAAVAFAVFKST